MTPESPTNVLEEASNFQTDAERLLARGRPDDIRLALQHSDSGLKLLTGLPEEDRSGACELESSLYLARANALRDLQDPSLGSPLAMYDKALSILEGRSSAPSDESRQLEANIWTNRGISLLQSPEPDILAEATRCFDRAITIRQALPRAMHQVLWGLAAGWMNRGDALTRQGDASLLPEAVKSYDEGIACLEELHAYDHPPFVIRVAVAWMNRGHTLMAMDTPESIARAGQSFQSSMDILRSHPQAESQEHVGTLACALMCHAASCIEQDAGNAEAVAAGTREALTLVRSFEAESLFATDVGIKSRHLLCRALATLLDHTKPDLPAAQEWMTEVTDTVDEGLALERHWEQRGIRDFRPICADLFRFGIRVFLLKQPHFLAEFIVECLDPEVSPGAPADSPEMHHLASAAVWDAALDLEKRHAAASPGAEREALIAMVEDLHEADRRLQELRQKHLSPR